MKLKKINIEDIYMEEFADLLRVVNKCIEGIVKAANPKDYKDNHDFFISMVLTAPAMISASIIEKIRGTFHLNIDEVSEAFIERTKLALSWEIHKSKLRESGIN